MNLDDDPPGLVEDRDSDDDTTNTDTVTVPSRSLLSPTIPISYPTDHKVDDFARNLKQDSHIQAYIASQNPSTMYPVA